MMEAQSSELDLWQELKAALASPQSADLHRLFNLLDWVIAQLPDSQQLDTAGRAIEQMVDVYALRFQVLMRVWEEADTLPEQSLPVLNLEALESWVRQSMAIDLDAYVEQPQSKRQRRQQKPNPEDSIVAAVEPELVLNMVKVMEADQEQDQLIQRLAGEEDPARWSAAIARWMKFHQHVQPVQFTTLLNSLCLSWVELWLGLLLGGFELEQTGEFYGEISIRLPESEQALTSA